MKKTRWIEIYKSAGKINFASLYNKIGVYLIRSKKTNKIVYIGYSGLGGKGNLAKTAIRHFQDWSNTDQKRVFFKNASNFQIKFYVCRSSGVAQKLELYLRAKLQPTKNPQKIDKSFAGNIENRVIDAFNNSDTFEVPF